MAKFTTLDTIVTDLLKIVRGSKVSESETISRRQLENWVHQYRALLLARELEKNYHPNPDYIQTLENVTVELYTDNDRDLYRTVDPIPKVIDINYDNSFMYVGDENGNEIHFVPQHREIWQDHRRYVSETPTAYLKNNKIYINNWDGSNIFIRGIFENPMEVARSNYRDTDMEVGDWNSAYPVPNNMVPVMKEMILKQELNITVKAPSDNVNDSHQGVEENTAKQ